MLLRPVLVGYNEPVYIMSALPNLAMPCGRGTHAPSPRITLDWKKPEVVQISYISLHQTPKQRLNVTTF